MNQQENQYFINLLINNPLGIECTLYTVHYVRMCIAVDKILVFFKICTLTHCKPIPCDENRVFPVKFSHREIPVMKTVVPAMRTGVSCNGNRFFPVWKTSQGKPCSGPVLALYGIAVYSPPLVKEHRKHCIFVWAYISTKSLNCLS